MNNTRHILSLFAATLLLAGCGKINTQKQSVAPIAVRTVTVDVTAGSGSRSYLGEVEAATGITLYHPLGGKLTALHVHNGQKVTQGQPVADVDDTQPRSMHVAAKATLLQAEDAYRRLLQVHDSGGLSEVKWMEMQTNLEKARQQEIATRKSLEDCHLTAPVDGVITDADVHVGQQLLPGQTVCTVLSMNALQVVFSVPESDVAAFATGDTVVLTLNALPERSLRGVVSEKSLSAGKVAHTYAIKAFILGPTGEVLPGMIAKVLTTKAFSDGLVVPSACVQTTPEGPAVWVVRDGKAWRQVVRSTRFVRDGVLVSEGLKAGEEVVTAGFQKLYNGAEVVVME